MSTIFFWPTCSSYGDFNPILRTWFRDSCFSCDGSSTIQVFTLLFNTGMVNGNWTMLEFSSKWVKVMHAKQGGGRAACSGGWGQFDGSQCWLCYHPKDRIQICEGYWTIQVHLIFKTCHDKFAYIKIYFCKTLIAIKLKSLWVWL
jgi:hypothetical protein